MKRRKGYRKRANSSQTQLSHYNSSSARRSLLAARCSPPAARRPPSTARGRPLTFRSRDGCRSSPPPVHPSKDQVTASMKRDVDGQIPNYPNFPAKLLCLLHNVTLHADPDADEVYA